MWVIRNILLQNREAKQNANVSPITPTKYTLYSYLLHIYAILLLHVSVYITPSSDRNDTKRVGVWYRNVANINCAKFCILLTVHHVMILGKWPTWRTVLFYVFIYIFNSLHISSTSCSSSGETNCVNTTSGSCHSVCRWLCRVEVGSFNSDLHTTLPPTATRGCIDTICLSWWCSKHVESYKYK